MVFYGMAASTMQRHNPETVSTTGKQEFFTQNFQYSNSC